MLSRKGSLSRSFGGGSFGGGGEAEGARTGLGAEATTEAPAPQDAVMGPGFLWRTGRLTDYLVLMGGICVCWLGVTTPQPYLNPWAQAHGVTAAQAGALFAAQPFAVVLVQPLVPCLARRCGQGRLLAAGLLLSSVSLVCFAVTPALELGDGLPLFAALGAAAWMAGVGEGVVETSTYTILQQRFPDVIGQVTGHAEAWVGIGTMMGPVLGGSLFSAGGFSLPPAVISVLLFVLASICLTWSGSLRSRRQVRRGRPTGGGQQSGSTPLDLGEGREEHREQLEPAGEDGAEEQEQDDGQPHLADTLVFLLVTSGISLAGFIGGACGPMMSTYYVDDFGWSEAFVGGIFGAYGIVYMVASVLVGVVADRGPRTARCVFACGAFLSAAGMAVSGREERIVSVAGVLALGAADACLLVPGLGLLAQCSPKRGGSFTASMLNGAYALGLGLGPLLAVPLSDRVGVGRATLGIGLVAAAYAVALALSLSARPCPEAASAQPEVAACPGAATQPVAPAPAPAPPV